MNISRQVSLSLETGGSSSGGSIAIAVSSQSKQGMLLENVMFRRDATRRDATRRDATRRDATRRDATRRNATRPYPRELFLFIMRQVSTGYFHLCKAEVCAHVSNYHKHHNTRIMQEFSATRRDASATRRDATRRDATRRDATRRDATQRSKTLVVSKS